MADSPTTIANLALSCIGIAQRVADIGSDDSKQAVQANRWYPYARDFVLRKGLWPWATRHTTPGLAGGSSSTPYNAEWQYAYRRPADCIKVLRVVDPALGRRSSQPIPFALESDTESLLIMCDLPVAEIAYTARIENTSLFDPDFDTAVAWKLAAYLVGPLSLDVKLKLQCEQMALQSISDAARAAAVESQSDQPLDSQAIQDRA